MLAGGRQQRTSHSSLWPSSRQFHTESTHPEVLHYESENKHRIVGKTRTVERALTWRWLVRVHGFGARLQGQTEARARESQFAEQDPHAAEHIALTARALTHSPSVVGDRGGARGSIRAGGRSVRY